MLGAKLRRPLAGTDRQWQYQNSLSRSTDRRRLFWYCYCRSFICFRSSSMMLLSALFE